jgi:septal ring factor EnvC (AmiA/AmiB activator)
MTVPRIGPALLLLAGLVLAGQAAGADVTQSPRQAGQELRMRLTAVLEENDALRASQERLARELAQLDLDIQAAQAQAQDLTRQEEDLGQRLPVLDRQEKTLAQAVLPLRQRYHRQLRALYLFGPEASMAFLASAGDFHDALTRAQALYSLLVRQQRDYQELQVHLARLHEVRTLQAARKDELDDLRQRGRQHLSELTQMRQARQGVLAEQRARQEALQDNIDALGEAEARLARTFALWDEGEAAPEGVTMAKGLLSPPVDGRVAGRAGPGGRGVLLQAREGAQVRAPWAGVVVHVGALAGFDQVVVLDHGERVHTVLAHLDSLAVEKGQEVKAGEVLGALDASATLYLEVRRGTRPENPLDWLRLNP